MSDEFDLLDTDSQTTGTKQKATDPLAMMDQMKSRLQGEEDPEVRQRILNATLDQVMGMANEDRKSLLDNIRDITDYQDQVGLKFEGFNTLNEEEERIITRAEAVLQKALADLEAAKIAPNSFFRKLAGFFNKKWSKEGAIDAAISKVKDLQKKRIDAENTAKQLFKQRIESADMEELLTQYANKSRATCDRLKEREQEILQQEEELKLAMEEANKVHSQALNKKAETETKLEEKTAKLNNEQTALTEIADKNSQAYADQLKVVTGLEQEVENLKGLVASYMALAASKDSFTLKHNLALKTLTTIRGNLRTHRAKLDSDTTERVQYYQGYVMALQARTDQEFAAILEKLGVKTDEAIGKTLASMYTASQKARTEMLDGIPEHEKNMAEVYSSYAESMSKFRTEDARIKAEFEDKYGINISEQFEQYYAVDGKEKNQPEESGDTSPKKETKATDDLLG